MDRGVRQKWLAHCALLERHGDSVRLLRELAAHGKFVATRQQLEDVEREGLLTPGLLDALGANPTLTHKIRSLLRARRQQPMSVLPAAIGRVWVPYIATDGRMSFVVTMTCTVDRDGVPALVTRRTSLWQEGLLRIVAVAESAVSARQPNASPDWSDRRVQFDVNDGRLGGELNRSDRSYELAALVALISAAYGRVLPAGTAAIGLVSERERGFRGALSREVDSVGFEQLCAKITGLVHSLPILSEVIVPRSDEDVARRLLARTRVDVIGVDTVEDVLSIAAGDKGSFRGGVRKTLLQRVVQRADRASSALRSRLPGVRDDAALDEYLFQMKNDLRAAREASGFGIGVFAGELAVAACSAAAFNPEWRVPGSCACLIFVGSIMVSYVAWSSSAEENGDWPWSSYMVAIAASAAYLCGWLLWLELWRLGRLGIFAGHPIIRWVVVATLSCAVSALLRAILRAALARSRNADRRDFWLPFLRANAMFFVGSQLLYLITPVTGLHFLATSVMALLVATLCWVLPRRVGFRNAALAMNLFATLSLLGVMGVMLLSVQDVYWRLRGWSQDPLGFDILTDRYARQAAIPLAMTVIAAGAFSVLKLVLICCDPLRLSASYATPWDERMSGLVPIDPMQGDIHVSLEPMECARSSEEEDRAG